jgi:hypothetical protein
MQTRRFEWLVPVLWRALGLAVLVWYFHFSVGRYIDDAFITLSYATTLAKFGVWGMARDLTSNAATSPLNVMLLALTIKIFRDPLVAVWMFNVFLSVAMYSSLRYFSLKIFGGETFAVIATALLVSNPLLNSTQGLESYLLVALVLLACRLWDEQSYRWLGLVLGALFLTRPDAVAVAAVFVTVLLVRRRWSVVAQVVGMFLLLVLPWLGYSWYHLGSLFPDTLLIKLGQGSWDGYSFFRGPLVYWKKTPTALLLSLALAPGLLYLRKLDGARRSLLLGLGLYAGLHFVAYSCLQVPPYHWYYAVETSTVVVFGAMAIYEASAMYRVTNIALLLIVVLLSAGCVIGAARVKGSAAISTNWGTPEQYKDMAMWINLHVEDKRVRSEIELGTLQYYTDADMIDVFSDRSSVVTLLKKPHSRVGGALLRWNYRHLKVEDLSQIRYELFLCRAGAAAEMEWTTETTAVGTREWCLYKKPVR